MTLANKWTQSPARKWSWWSCNSSRNWKGFTSVWRCMVYGTYLSTSHQAKDRQRQLAWIRSFARRRGVCDRGFDEGNALLVVVDLKTKLLEASRIARFFNYLTRHRCTISTSSSSTSISTKQCAQILHHILYFLIQRTPTHNHGGITRRISLINGIRLVRIVVLHATSRCTCRSQKILKNPTEVFVRFISEDAPISRSLSIFNSLMVAIHVPAVQACATSDSVTCLNI